VSPALARTRPRRVVAWLVGCLLWLAGPTLASAAPLTSASLTEAAPMSEPASTPELVLIRVAPDDPRLRARLEAELDISGLEVRTLDWPEPDAVIGPTLLDELAPHGASAAIEIYIRDDRVEVWVADATTETALTRRFDRQPDAEQARTVAVGAVELLRASRLEYAESHPELAETDPFVKQATESERPPKVVVPTTASLSISPLVGSSPGGFGVTGHLEIAARWAVRRPLLLSFDLWIPVYGGQSDFVDGVNARNFVTMLFIEPQWSPSLRRAEWLHPTLGLGVGPAVLVTIGEVVLDEVPEPADSNIDVVAGFAATAHVDFGFSVHPRVWLRAGAHLGVIQPAFRINLVNDDTKTYGLPFAMGSLGLEFWI